MSDNRQLRDRAMTGMYGRSADGEHVTSDCIGNDFTNGHRGMARAVAGAKKYVRSRIRAKEKIALRRMVDEL